jgi:hypothetical protein
MHFGQVTPFFKIAEWIYKIFKVKDGANFVLSSMNDVQNLTSAGKLLPPPAQYVMSAADKTDVRISNEGYAYAYIYEGSFWKFNRTRRMCVFLKNNGQVDCYLIFKHP